MKTAAFAPRHRIEALFRKGLHALRVALRTLRMDESNGEAAPVPAQAAQGGQPRVLGPLRLSLGADCRVSDRITFTGRDAGANLPESGIPEGDIPELRVGRNVDIGWETTIAVGRRVTLGDNVRIAGRAMLAGYPAHPLPAAASLAAAAGAVERSDGAEPVGDIVIEDDVWLSTGVVVGAGVRIGRGTVVAAGSVVTHDLPPMVLAGGIPARVIRPLAPGPTGRLL